MMKMPQYRVKNWGKRTKKRVDLTCIVYQRIRNTSLKLKTIMFGKVKAGLMLYKKLWMINIMMMTMMIAIQIALEKILQFVKHFKILRILLTYHKNLCTEIFNY